MLKPGTSTYLAFRTAARGMAAEAQNQKEVLVRTLDQFDAAVESGRGGFQSHVGASAEPRAVADEIVRIVRVMDGLNRYRFLNDAELLATWESASNVLAAPRNGAPKPGPGGTPPDGEIRPAA